MAGSTSGEGKSHTVWIDATTSLWFPLLVGSVFQVDNPFNNLWSVPISITSASISDFNHSLTPFLVPSAMKNDLAYYFKRIKKSVQKLLAYVFLYFNIISILSPCSTKVVKTNFSAREFHCPLYFFSGLWLCCGGWGESERNKEFYVLCCHMATEASFELSSSPHSWSVIGKGFHRDLCFSGGRGSFHYCYAILGPTLVMRFVSPM